MVATFYLTLESSLIKDLSSSLFIEIIHVSFTALLSFSCIFNFGYVCFQPFQLDRAKLKSFLFVTCLLWIFKLLDHFQYMICSYYIDWQIQNDPPQSYWTKDALKSPGTDYT